MRVLGVGLAFWVVATIAVQISTAGEARAQSNPVGYTLTWGQKLGTGQIKATCTSPTNQNCILNDSATYAVNTPITTSPLNAKITPVSSVIHSDRYGKDVPWCIIQITCHDGGGAQHWITDEENGAACSSANAMAHDTSGAHCDIADEILILVGVNRGGFAWYW